MLSCLICIRTYYSAGWHVRVVSWCTIRARILLRVEKIKNRIFPLRRNLLPQKFQLVDFISVWFWWILYFRLTVVWWWLVWCEIMSPTGFGDVVFSFIFARFTASCIRCFATRGRICIFDHKICYNESLTILYPVVRLFVVQLTMVEC